MRNTRATLMLVFSLVIGLAAAFMAASWVQQRGDTASKEVVVAAVDIELGSRINPQMLKSVPWPGGEVPIGSFNDIQSLNERVVKTSVQRGEALLEAKLAPVGTKGGLSAVIKEGNRAMTVRVNDVIGVAGFALPGNYVDVVVNTQQEGGGNEAKQISKIVLTHMLVLAVAQEASRDDTKPKVVSAVTLEVTPEQAEKLDLARSVGTLSLVLRNQIDGESITTAGITKRQLLTGEVAPAPVVAAAPVRARRTVIAAAPPLPPRNCVEVIKGGIKATECF